MTTPPEGPPPPPDVARSIEGPPPPPPEPAQASSAGDREATPTPLTVRSFLAGLFDVVIQGARLWWRHWPLLLSIALLGGAVRMGAIWAATAASANNNTLGFAVLMLAPLGSVVAIVLMLYVLRGGLPHLAEASSVHAPVDPTTHRERRLLDLLASVLVPFLAVYASYGYLREDRQRFLNAAAAQEYLENAGIFYEGADKAIYSERFFVATGWVVVAIVLVAIVLRWGLARLEGKVHATPLGFVGAYVEVFWMAVLASELGFQKDRIWAWAESRRGLDIVLGWWANVLDLLGPVAGPVDAVAAWAAGVIGNLDDLVVVPLAWLAVGAVVFGHKLAPPPRPGRRLAPLERVPSPVRKWAGQAFQPIIGDVRNRLNGLVGGLRQLAVGGLGPMLVFGIAFLAATRLEDVLAFAIRAVVGPQSLDTWLAFSPHVGTVTRAVGLTVTIALLAAAIDRVMARDRSAATATGDGGAVLDDGAVLADEAPQSSGSTA